MPVKNPPHPGAGLKEDIEALGLSVAEAATGLGVTRQQLYRVIRGQSGISPEMALRLEKAIGGTAAGLCATAEAAALISDTCPVCW